jgi:hypothetical protein
MLSPLDFEDCSARTVYPTPEFVPLAPISYATKYWIKQRPALAHRSRPDRFPALADPQGFGLFRPNLNVTEDHQNS